MKSVLLFLCAFIWILTGVAWAEKAGLGKDVGDSYQGKVVVIGVGEDALSSKQAFAYMARVIKKAEEEKAIAIVFDLNTPGGLAWETSELMMKELSTLKIKSYAFVNNKAMSAGALISSACDAIYMTPTSSIGAAGLVTGTGEKMDDMMRKKAESAFDAFTRSVVSKKGHNVALIRAMMIPKEEEQTFGAVKVAKDSLLTLTGEEAVAKDADGIPLLAKGLVKDVDELLLQEGITAPVVRAEPTGFEQIGLWIAWASPVLILLAMAGIYIEFKTPGFGMGGTVAIIAFALFFFGNSVAGNLAGYETVGLLVLGIVLIIIEFTVLPGTFVPGIVGAGCVLLALFSGMLSGIELDHFMEQGDWSTGAILTLTTPAFLKLGLGMFGGMIAIIAMMKYLPESRMMRPIVNADVSGGVNPGEAVVKAKVAVGEEGVAITELKPNGKAQFGSVVCEVCARGGVMPMGTAVRVVRVRSFDYEVDKVS